MDFNDTKEEAEFRAEVRAWLEANAELRGPDDPPEDMLGERLTDHDIAATRAWQKKKAEAGWACLRWPKEYGGREATSIQSVIWGQEESRFRTPPNIFGIGHGMCGPTIMTHGTEEQKQRWIPGLLSGEELWCQLFSEPAAGSDLAGLRTGAVRDGDDWIVNGQKTWCSGAQHTQFGILIARTDPKAPKHQGVTYFLLDMKTPGITVQPLVEMTGEARFNEVFLNDVRVPDSARLGAVGQGWAITQTTLLHERMSMGGLASLLDFDALRAFVLERVGTPDPLLRDELARVYTELKCLQLLNARVVTKLGRGQMPTAESSVMKLALARVMTRAAEAAMRAMGPGALLRRGFWQNEFLFAPAWHIAGGTDQVQKNVCAERVLGLPRDPHDARDVPFDELPRS